MSYHPIYVRYTQTLRQEQTRNHDVSMIVYSGDTYAVFDARFLIGLLIRLPQDILYRLRPHFLVV